MSPTQLSLKHLRNGVKIPGVTFHKETKSTVRAGKAREAILIGGGA